MKSNFVYILILVTLKLCSQNCPNLVLNGDFEVYDSDCVENLPNGVGISAFGQFLDCVDEWQSQVINIQNTADLLLPLSNFPNNSFGEMNNYVISSQAGFCYGNSIFGHIEWIEIANLIEIQNSLEFDVSLKLDIAASCSNSIGPPGNWPLLNLTPGQLNIDYLVAGSVYQNLTSIVVDNDLQNGLINTTIDIPQPNSGTNSIRLKFGSQTINPPESGKVCWIIIDNVSLQCEILDPNLEIEVNELPNGDSEFSLVNDGTGTSSSVSSYLWTFEDGTTSDDSNPTNGMIPSCNGMYTVCVDIIDDVDCCSTICAEFGTDSSGDCCGNFVLTNGNVQDLADLLSISDPYNLLFAQAEVLIEGIFTVDENLQLSDGLNFYMAEGSQIEAQNGVLFRKVGGFIKSCDNAEWNHIRSTGGTFYLHSVEISGATHAIQCEGGTGDIISCDIDGCNIGIQMYGADGLFLSHNFIDVDHTAINADQSSSFVAQFNKIGTSTPVVSGINLYNGSDGVMNNNTIESSYRSIASNYSIGVMSANIIENDGDAGIFSFESDVFIDGNYVDGSGDSGIFFTSNGTGLASSNLVSGDFDRSFNLQASQSHQVYSNNVTGNGDVGIYNNNSAFNTFECNYLTGLGNYGLYNGSNSVMHQIITNIFSGDDGLDADFYSNSEFGPQPDHGNTGWCYTEANVDSDNSFFSVSDLTQNCVETPALSNPTDLFKGGNSPMVCGNTPGPTGTPSITFICWWLEYLTNLPSDKKNSLWINSYHVIKRYKAKVPESEWPECLWIFMLNTECGMQQLVESEVEYMKALSNSKLEMQTIREQYNAKSSGEDRTNNQAYVNALRQIKESKNQTLSTLRVQQTERLSTVPCTDEMFLLWRSVYLLRLKNHDEVLNKSDLAYLSYVSGLCASEYGDPVHWARGLLSSYTMELPEANDECVDEALEEREAAIHQKMVNVQVYPNPVSSVFTVELTGDKNGALQLTTLSGSILKYHDLVEGLNSINVEDLSNGIYMIKTKTDNYEKTEKLIIHR